MVLFATIGILFFGLFFVRPLLRILQIPRSIMMPIIFVLCTVGSFAIAWRLFDVWTMLGFGTLAFLMRVTATPSRHSCWGSCSVTFSTRVFVAGWC